MTKKLDLNDPNVQEALKADAKALADAAQTIAAKYTPTDIDPSNVVVRTALLSMAVNTSRTSLLGAALWAGSHGPSVGLTKEQLIAIVSESYDAAAALPMAAAVAESYAEKNAQAKLDGMLAKVGDKVH